MKRIILIGALALALTGCGPAPTPQELAARDKYNLENPEIVGTSQEGFQIKRSAVYNSARGRYDYVYMVGSVTTVNSSYRNGKVDIDHTEVIVTPLDQIIQRGEEAKRKQIEADENNFKF